MKLDEITITISSKEVNTGKTTLACLIANALHEAGITNVNFVIPGMMTAQMKRHFEQMMRDLKMARKLHNRPVTIVEEIRS